MIYQHLMVRNLQANKASVNQALVSMRYHLKHTMSTLVKSSIVDHQKVRR